MNAKDLQDDEEWGNKKHEVIFEYEHVRFSVQYQIYQRMDLWKLIDSIALNFHLITAFVTVLLCTEYQISLFMLLQLTATVVMCFRVSHAMYLYGREFKYDNAYKGLQVNTEKDRQRNKISQGHFRQEYITIDTAYDLNKSYKLAASEKLMAVRQTNWFIQYWLLLVSMILMYPTPLLTLLADKHEGISEQVSVARFWLFWSGIYSENSAN